MMKLEVGYLETVPDGVNVAWGAVVRYVHDFKFENPFEGEQDYVSSSDSLLKGLLDWLNTVGFSKLKRVLEVDDIRPHHHQEVTVESKRYVLKGNPKASGEVIYLTAWKKPQ